mgnify:CR=1 FL=1
MAYHEKDIGSVAQLIKDRTMSNKVRVGIKTLIEI